MTGKNKLKNIALIDLNHMAMGLHTNTVPLGIGMIARYFTKNVPGIFDIRIFKDPHKFMDGLKIWKPDVLGVALYSWNSELDLYMAGIAKKANPACVIIAGGPDLYLTRDEKFNYLKERGVVDVCVSQDGEIPFATIVKRLLAGESIVDIRRAPSAGTYCIDPVTGEFIEPADSAPRLATLDVFGTMYADGWFDSLLDDGFHPFLQTHRGCPFKCIYCHTGDEYQSKMIFQSAADFERDMEYLGKRYAGQHNITLYMSNTNFGLFKEDFEIARIIRRIQDKHDWPKAIIVNSGKDPDKLLDLISILKYKFIPYISLQTLTPKVLQNIRRRNIPFKDFVRFQKIVMNTISENTTTELILSLPGETKESFLKTFITVLNSGVQNIVIYTLMSLKGTLLASPEYAARYGHVIRHRILPRCFSEIDSRKIFETEEVVVGTTDMPFEDYVELRGLTFLAIVFASSIEMFPVRKFLLERGLKVSDWIFGIHYRIKDYPDIYNVYQRFLRETEGELFKTREGLVKYFSKDDNYKALCEGNIGDNLLRKYKLLILSRYYDEFLRIALSELDRVVGSSGETAVTKDLMLDFETYLKTRDVGHVFSDGYKESRPREIRLTYDIPRWLLIGDNSFKLEKYKGTFYYSVMVSEYARDKLKGFNDFKRDPELSLQIIYRDGYIKDFWPVWRSSKTYNSPIIEGKKASLRDIMNRSTRVRR